MRGAYLVGFARPGVNGSPGARSRSRRRSGAASASSFFAPLDARACRHGLPLGTILLNRRRIGPCTPSTARRLPLHNYLRMTNPTSRVDRDAPIRRSRSTTLRYQLISRRTFRSAIDRQQVPRSPSFLCGDAAPLGSVPGYGINAGIRSRRPGLAVSAHLMAWHHLNSLRLRSERLRSPTRSRATHGPRRYDDANRAATPTTRSPDPGRQGCGPIRTELVDHIARTAVPGHFGTYSTTRRSSVPGEAAPPTMGDTPLRSGLPLPHIWRDEALPRRRSAPPHICCFRSDVDVETACRRRPQRRPVPPPLHQLAIVGAGTRCHVRPTNTSRGAAQRCRPPEHSSPAFALATAGFPS